MEIGKDRIILTFPTQLNKRKWLRPLTTFIEENASAPEESKRESVAQMKAVQNVTVPPRPERRKKKRVGPSSATIRGSETVQNNPEVQELRQLIAEARKGREEAEATSERLKHELQLAGNKESKQQRASGLQGRIGSLCGVVGSLSSQNANLQQKIFSYSQEIQALQG